jgi:hypothetical protein
MALRPCKECGHEVAASAKACPECGVKHPAHKGATTGKGCLLVIVVFIVGMVLISVVDSDSPEIPVDSGPTGVLATSMRWGEDWPLTVDRGIVDCVPPSAAVFRHGGVEYQLNGAAASRGYASIDPIWRDNPRIPGTKVSLGPLIQLALRQCP